MNAQSASLRAQFGSSREHIAAANAASKGSSAVFV